MSDINEVNMGKNSTQQTADDKIAQSAHLPLKPAHQAQFHNLLESFQTPDNILLLSLEAYSVTFLNPLKVSTQCYFWLPKRQHSGTALQTLIPSRNFSAQVYEKFHSLLSTKSK